MYFIQNVTLRMLLEIPPLYILFLNPSSLNLVCVSIICKILPCRRVVMSILDDMVELSFNKVLNREEELSRIALFC